MTRDHSEGEEEIEQPGSSPGGTSSGVGADALFLDQSATRPRSAIRPSTRSGRPETVEGRNPKFAIRGRALLQVFICSGVPTQLLIIQVLAAFGLRPALDGERLNAVWVFALALGDTVLLVTLACLMLRADGESPRAVFLGARRPIPEVLLGLATVIPLLLMAAAVLLAIRARAPWLHNVPENPLAGLLSSPRDAWLFTVVALIAGGVREELQRAFLITRFERHLGGAAVGLVVTSVAFGLGHSVQGWDAAVATGLLGFAWGAMYLWRRSAIAPMASHAGFNGFEIVRYLVVGPNAI